jgi:hypothetical protein
MLRQRQPALVPVEVVVDADDKAAVADRHLRLITRGGHRDQHGHRAEAVAPNSRFSHFTP